MYKSDYMSAWNREVLVLYRRLLRLHASLPPDLRALGEGYLREEFRRHRGGADVHVTAFKKEWSRFADVLATQVRSPSPAATSPDQVGSNLPPELLDGFRDEQIGQLYKLKLETTSYGRPLQAADKDGQ